MTTRPKTAAAAKSPTATTQPKAATRAKAAAPKPPRSARRPVEPSPEVGDSAMQRILRHWREAVPNDRMAHLVKDATRSLDRALQTRLAAHAVSFGHWVFLRILWEGDGLTQRDLSREAGVMEPTTFAAVKVMESRGYIVRRPFVDNRRKIHIFLTARGRALKRALVPLAEEINRIALAGASVADVTATRRTLLALLENLAREEARSVSESGHAVSPREAARSGGARSGGAR